MRSNLLNRLSRRFRRNSSITGRRSAASSSGRPAFQRTLGAGIEPLERRDLLTAVPAPDYVQPGDLLVQIEASGSGRFRSLATNARTKSTGGGAVLTITHNLEPMQAEVLVVYSNDQDTRFAPERLQLTMGDFTTPDPVPTIDTKRGNLSPGQGWNSFHAVSLGTARLTPELELSIIGGDGFGIELDAFIVRPQPVTISGTVFEDVNNNGAIDVSEPGLANVRVFVDLDGDGSRDQEEPAGTSGVNGSYTIANVPPGSFTVLQELPAGYQRTFPAQPATVDTRNGNVSGLNFANAKNEQPQPKVSLAAAEAQEGETLVFHVTLDRAATEPVVIQYETAAGTAAAGVDYETTADTLTIAAGQQAGEIRVPTIEDQLTETDETFEVRLTGVTNGELQDTSADGTILDDETIVRFELTTTDLQGNPIDQVSVGDAFQLRVMVDDLLTDAVFAAYLDLLYDHGKLNLDGPVAFGSHFPNGQSATTAVAGLIDEAGGFGDTQSAPGPLRVITATFVSTAAGNAEFTANPADELPAHAILTYGRNVPVPEDRLSFARTAITIVENTAPRTAADSYEVPEDQVRTVPANAGVLTNDSDPDGDALTAEIVDPPENGSVTMRADGSFDYTPAADFNGEDTFTYRALDARGAASPATTVVIEVTPVNDRPVAVADHHRVAQDGRLVVGAESGLLVNDTDIDSPHLAASVSTQPNSGRLNLNADGSFEYVPNPGFTGTDRFTYSVSDGALDDQATVTLDVFPPDVQFRLQFADDDGEPVQTSVPDADLWLQVYASDLRSAPAGVFAAYLDLTYPSALLQVDATREIQFSDDYPNGRSGDSGTAGSIDEVGGFSGSTRPTGGEEQLVVSIPFRAVAEGDATVVSDPADVEPDHSVLLFGNNRPVDVALIRYGQAALEIKEECSQNPNNRFDVNDDTAVSPIDVLQIINDLNENGSRELPLPPNCTAPPFLDVNGDGFVSPLDVLQVINQINGTPDGEGEGSFLPLAPTRVAADRALAELDRAAPWATFAREVFLGQRVPHRHDADRPWRPSSPPAASRTSLLDILATARAADRTAAADDRDATSPRAMAQPVESLEAALDWITRSDGGL